MAEGLKKGDKVWYYSLSGGYALEVLVNKVGKGGDPVVEVIDGQDAYSWPAKDLFLTREGAIQDAREYLTHQIYIALDEAKRLTGYLSKVPS